MADVKNKRLKAGMSGVAGEYYVAGEMSRLGYIASITLRNTKGIDILASCADGSKTVAIQVKTNQDKHKMWLLDIKAESSVEDNLYYVFVNLNNGQGKPGFHIAPSCDVAKFAAENHIKWLSGAKRDGSARKDTNMREFKDADGVYEDRWDLLGL